MKIAISAESTIDVQQDILNEYDIKTVPFTIVMGEKTGLDGEVKPEDIFHYFEETGNLAKTSAVNEFQYEEHFGKLLEEYDAVIHLSLSQTLSSAYQNAVEASQKFQNVFVIDTMSLSTGIALLAIYARKLADEGKEPKEIVEMVNERIPFTQASFIISAMNYLHKGGRCSRIGKIAALIFRIKPQIVVRDGKMIPGKNYRGHKAACVKSYCEDILDEFNCPDTSVAFLTHSNATEAMIEAAKETLVAHGFKKIYTSVANGTISCHCGPACLGILYLNDGEH